MYTKYVSFTRQNGAMCSKSQMHIRQEIDQPQQEVATPIHTVHASATTVKILTFLIFPLILTVYVNNYVNSHSVHRFDKQSLPVQF